MLVYHIFFPLAQGLRTKLVRLFRIQRVTADIEIGEQVRGEGTRAELLGFIRWGDPGRATFTARQQERDLVEQW